MKEIEEWLNKKMFDWLRKRLYRQETTQRRWAGSSGTEKGAPPTFIPDMILEETWNRDDKAHLDKVARQDPIAHYICFKLAENVFDDGFVFVDDDGKEIMQKVKQELIQLDADKYLPLVLAGERTHGVSWLYIGSNRVRTDVEEGAKVAQLDYFTPLNLEVIKYDGLGQPLEMEITVLTAGASNTVLERKVKLPAKDFIPWRTRPYDRSYKGRSALYSIWDYLVYIRFTFHAMFWYNMKIGLGAFLIKLKGALTSEAKTAANAMLEDLSVKRGLVVEDKKVEDVGFIGAQAGATRFHEDLDAALKMVAMGTGVPKDILTGVAAGAITGSEINNKNLYATLNQIQKSVEPMIRELVKRMGYQRTNYHIEWNTRFAHDEEEQSKIRYMDAQALAIKTWLTPNEKREEEGREPIEGGDELEADFKISAQGFEPRTEQEKQAQTRNPTGANL